MVKNRGGEVEVDAMIWWIIGIVVLVLVVILFFILKDKGINLLAYVKNLFKAV